MKISTEESPDDLPEMFMPELPHGRIATVMFDGRNMTFGYEDGTNTTPTLDPALMVFLIGLMQEIDIHHQQIDKLAETHPELAALFDGSIKLDIRT